MILSIVRPGIASVTVAGDVVDSVVVVEGCTDYNAVAAIPVHVIVRIDAGTGEAIR